MGIVSVEKVIRNNKRQLIYIHEQPPEVLSGHRRHVNYVSAVSIYPEITGVHSLETVATKGARLRSCSPVKFQEYSITKLTDRGIIKRNMITLP